METNRPNIIHRIISVFAAVSLLASIAAVIWLSGTSYLKYGIPEDLIRTISAVLCIYFLVLFISDMIACLSDKYRLLRSTIRGRNKILCELELALMMMLPVTAVFIYQALFDELTYYIDKDITFFILVSACLIHITEYIFTGISILFDIVDSKQQSAPINGSNDIDLHERKEEN